MGFFSLILGKKPSSDDLSIDTFTKPRVEEPPIPESDLPFYEEPEYYTDFVPSFSLKAKNGMLRVQSFAERKKTSYPSPRGLYVGEIALIHYCSFGDYPGPKRGYPGFWWFEYGMKNVDFYLKSLEERGFIQMQENGKYLPTELGKQEVKDNYYVVYMRNAPGMTIDNLEASDDFSVWGINRRLAGGDPTKWESALMDIWREIDEHKAAQKSKRDAELKAKGIDMSKYPPFSDKPKLNWYEIGFRNDLSRVAAALNIDTSESNLLPVGYLQAVMRRVLDSFLCIERAKDVTVFFERTDLIKRDLQQLSSAELHGAKFNYSPSFLLWCVETKEPKLFSIVVENCSAAQMDKICTLKTDRGRFSSNQKWKSSIESLLDGRDDGFKEIVQSEYEKLESAREKMKNEV